MSYGNKLEVASVTFGMGAFYWRSLGGCTSGLVAGSRDSRSEEHAYGMSLYRGRGKYPDGRLPG